MRIGFFGTPGIAASCLKKLHDIFPISFVVTGEDKQVGRNRKIQHNPVKQTALENNITLFQPAELLDNEFIDAINREEADLFVVVAFGKILPPEVFSLPRYKSINLHPSLLPRYRGAAPIEWALINGESETGITIQILDESLDTGDIVAQIKIPVTPDMTANELYTEAHIQGAELLISTIEKIRTGAVAPKPQNHTEATYCAKIDKQTARIDWKKEARQIHNLVRGLNPKPVSWSAFREKNIKIWQTRLFSDENIFTLGPGQIAVFQKKRLLAGTGKNYIEILKIQPENKKLMDASAFINGYRLEKGEHFSDINDITLTKS